MLLAHLGTWGAVGSPLPPNRFAYRRLAESVSWGSGSLRPIRRLALRFDDVGPEYLARLNSAVFVVCVVVGDVISYVCSGVSVFF